MIENNKENDKEIKGELQTNKIDIKKKRKSMMNQRNLINFEEYQNNKLTKDSNASKKNTNTKLNSIISSSITNLRLNDLEEKTEKNNKENKDKIKKKSKRKSMMVRQTLSLDSFLKLKGLLTNISELIIKQEPDITEAICSCQQPNNYHVYIRELNDTISYTYKLREFSGDCNRICCPVNCREFTLKMKLMSDISNKYDNNFDDCLITMERKCKMPCLCCIRPDIVIDLTNEKSTIGRVEKSFSFCDPCFTIYNENNEEIYYIEAKCCQFGFICRNYSCGKTDDCQFFIYNSKERDNSIGHIMKKTESVFSLADTYQVTFPPKIKSEDKFLLSIAAVLIDYHYYEQNNEVIQ